MSESQIRLPFIFYFPSSTANKDLKQISGIKTYFTKEVSASVNNGFTTNDCHIVTIDFFKERVQYDCSEL